MIPANQGLNTDQARGVPLGLTVENEMIGADCRVKVMLHDRASFGRELQVGGKEANGIAALDPGLIQGQFCLLQNLVRGSRFSSEEGDALA